MPAPVKRLGWFVLPGVGLVALAAAVTIVARRANEPARDVHGFIVRPPAPAFAGEPSSGSVVPLSSKLFVDQFGYRPTLDKVAIAVGANAPETRFQLRRWDDATLVAEAIAKPWNGGAIDPMSGDRGSWIDFSAVTEPGTYFVFDPTTRTRSPRFRIANDVYRDVLRAAMRMFYYNRANSAKRAPEACVADKCWTQDASYIGKGQDTEARSVRARDDAKTARDLSGGWWDAGDVNKYVTFAASPVHQLLSSYMETPHVFTDDFGIPESNNGLPDLIDELLVELDWLKRMQPDDLGGGVLLKVGNVEFSDPVPESSRHRRYYYPEPCSAATIDAAGMFAHAALVLRDTPRLAETARDLGLRAERAFTYFHAHPIRDDCDDGTIFSGDADRSLEQQTGASVVAAVYLFALTQEARYRAHVAEHYQETLPFRDDQWSVYEPEQGDALLVYAGLPGADAEVKLAIHRRKLELAKSSDIFGFRPELDLYRAYMPKGSYHWGSNMPRANTGNTNWDLILRGLLTEDEVQNYVRRAAELLHAFHGVNPLGLVYLSNMGPYGAERSVSEIFHAWFRDGDRRWDSALVSALGPAPGYVVGGPNGSYCQGDDSREARCSASALLRLPPGKIYRDFNTGFEPKLEFDRSWELSEPAIYYQASYVKLLAKFIGQPWFARRYAPPYRPK